MQGLRKIRPAKYSSVSIQLRERERERERERKTANK